MNRRDRATGRRFERGIVAIEMAAILPVMLALLAFCLFFGRVFYHYTAAHKAAHDAARYLSSVPPRDMSTPARVAEVVRVANDIAEAETAELNPGPYRPVVNVLCDTLTCDGFSPPPSITVGVRLAMFDGTFYLKTYEVLGDSPMALTAAVTMRYVGK